MPVERRERLEALPRWSWDPFGEKWDHALDELSRYCEMHGDCRVHLHYKTKDGFRLGRWVQKQRETEATMAPDRKERLEALKGWVWNTQSYLWETGFEQLRSYSEEHGDCLVPFGYRTEDGFRLGQWVTVQRKNRETLAADRKRRLEQLNKWVWEPYSYAWEEGYRRLTSYLKAEGDCLVPKEYRMADGYRLGQWVSTQRKTRTKMEKERRDRLEGLRGWVWRKG